MSQESPNTSPDEAIEKAPTPLEQVREQQAMQQQSKEVQEQRNEPSPEVPGQSSPSNIRKHPQRRMG